MFYLPAKICNLLFVACSENSKFKVDGKHVVTKLNGKVVEDYNELEGVTAGRRIDKGSFAIQAHDPKSVVRYRNIMVKPFN